MKKELKGFLKIFSFTFRQHIKSKGYLLSGILVSLLCLILPVTVMVFAGRPHGEEPDENAEITQMEEEEWQNSAVQKNEKIHTVYVVDQIETLGKDGQKDCYSILNSVGDERFTDIVYENFPDVDTAAEAAAGKDGTLLLVAEQGAYEQKLSVLLPEDTVLTEEDAREYEGFLYQYYTAVLMEKAGLDAGMLAELSQLVDVQVADGREEDEADQEVISGWEDADEEDPESEESTDMEMLKEILSMVLPYATVMVLYFMILAYGQGVANSVIMEKNSRLMDMFLVTVRPGAMILGKVLAIAASGLLQLFAWILCLAGSFAAGTAAVKYINPENDMLLIRLFDTFGELSKGLFSVTGILFTVLILISGFLLYCALAAVGGAMASKPEDLSTTNILFTMALIISFLLALRGGALQGELASTSWMLYMPFTAILLAPGMALLGKMTVLQCMISSALIVITAFFVILAAGRIYRALIFHKGDPVPVQKVLKILAGRRA